MPLQTILGTLIGAIGIKDVVGGLFSPFKDTLYDETMKGVSRIFKWNVMFKGLFAGLKQFAVCFDDIAESDPDTVSGISSRGLIDIFDSLISFTLVLSALIGDELSEELLLELLQEGISNAIQTSIGGAFQTILNVYRGGQPVYGDDVVNVPQIWDNVDDKINAFNVASSGLNFPAIVHYLTVGVKNKIDDMFRSADHIVNSFIIRCIEEEFWWISTYLELARNNLLSKLRYIVDVTSKYVDIAVSGVESTLSRLNDMLQEITTEINRLEAGLSTEDYAVGVYNEVLAEFNALKSETEKFISTMSDMINKVTAISLDTDLSLYNEAMDRYRRAVADMIDLVNGEYVIRMSIDFNHIVQLVDMVLAYRYYADRATYEVDEAQNVKVIEKSEGYIIPASKLQINVITMLE